MGTTQNKCSLQEAWCYNCRDTYKKRLVKVSQEHCQSEESRERVLKKYYQL